MQELSDTHQNASPRSGLAPRALRPWNVLAIAVAAISPTTSVFLVYGSGLASAGTGVVWAFVIGAAIALAMALCYAEVGSVFPSAGGAYTIVRRALGSVLGGATGILFLVLGLTSTASILVASATYLDSLVGGGLPVGWVALGMMALVTALSVGRITPASWVAAAMLALEIAVILVFTVVAFAHASGSSQVRPFTGPLVPTGHGSALTAVGAGALLAAVVPALFAFNGYDWPLYFSEESSGARRALPRAVVLAAVIAVVVEVLAVIAATLAIHDLPGTVANSAPLSLIAHQVMGRAGADVLIAGVVIAMFDTGLAANLGYARIYYAVGRDGLLPGPVARFFGHVLPGSKVPGYAFAFLFVGNGVLCVFTSLSNLITFTGVVIATIYLLVAVSSIVSRVRDRGLAGTFRMPLWPLPPLVAIAGVAVALANQETKDLVIALPLAAVAVLGFWLVRRRLPGRLDGLPGKAPERRGGEQA
ncbi:amino acid permease [Mangrovactinospora gilvigrisea]|uniref:Amino acid permease n=1 Tax=Mangrovactinospora gilvigrisea TaxID=1428644 RepID=A0A1J7BB71_9ACTN|nr:APC family permease [Mangrovactinospora gilvigrisea]OIV35935.1 amino acid permease [Mangrovactinospora gilvigrisea]